jgi:hypothetical protein
MRFTRFDDAGMSMSEAADAFTRALPSTHEGEVSPSTPDDGFVASGGPCGECDRSWPCWNDPVICYRLPLRQP